MALDLNKHSAISEYGKTAAVHCRLQCENHCCRCKEIFIAHNKIGILQMIENTLPSRFCSQNVLRAEITQHNHVYINHLYHRNQDAFFNTKKTAIC